MTGVNSTKLHLCDDAALFSMAIDRGCYNAATDKKSPSADGNFSFGGILHKGNSFKLSEPGSKMGAVRNDSQKKPSRRVTKELPSSSGRLRCS